MENLPQFGRIYIYGVLEFKWEDPLNYTLSATHILISGGRLIVGWEVGDRFRLQVLTSTKDRAF